MSQDVELGVIGSVTQADLAPLRDGARLGEFALVYRIERLHRGGRRFLEWRISAESV